MPQPVAVINGIAVYSDKPVSHIVNTRIFFHDGSWCDVKSGHVSNMGNGYINIGAPPLGKGKNEEVKTFGPKEYEADKLLIAKVVGNVTIMPHDKKVISVEIKGPKSLVELIDVDQGGGLLDISGSEKSVTFSSSSSQSRSFGNVVIGGITMSQCSFVGSADFSQTEIPELTIKVPKFSPINIFNIFGRTKIGDIEGPLVVELQGVDDVVAGKVTDADLKLQGAGNIKVNEVNGQTKMQIQGTGNINIKDGQADWLEIHVQGVGNARFNGTAENARLYVQGVGDIYVREVKNRPRKSVEGLGTIHVGNW